MAAVHRYTSISGPVIVSRATAALILVVTVWVVIVIGVVMSRRGPVLSVTRGLAHLERREGN